MPRERMCSSEWHKPAASIWIRTSFALGGSSSSSVISHGVPALRSTAALVFMWCLQIGAIVSDRNC